MKAKRMALRVFAAFFSFISDMRFRLVICVLVRAAKRFARAASLKVIGAEGDLTVVLVPSMFGSVDGCMAEIDWTLLMLPTNRLFPLVTERDMLPSLPSFSTGDRNGSSSVSKSSQEVTWEFTAALTPGILRTMEKIARVVDGALSSSSDEPEWSADSPASLLLWSTSRCCPPLNLPPDFRPQQWNRPLRPWTELCLWPGWPSSKLLQLLELPPVAWRWKRGRSIPPNLPTEHCNPASSRERFSVSLYIRQYRMLIIVTGR